MTSLTSVSVFFKPSFVNSFISERIFDIFSYLNRPNFYASDILLENKPRDSVSRSLTGLLSQDSRFNERRSFCFEWKFYELKSVCCIYSTIIKSKKKVHQFSLKLPQAWAKRLKRVLSKILDVSFKFYLFQILSLWVLRPRGCEAPTERKYWTWALYSVTFCLIENLKLNKSLKVNKKISIDSFQIFWHH